MVVHPQDQRSTPRVQSDALVLLYLRRRVSQNLLGQIPRHLGRWHRIMGREMVLHLLHLDGTGTCSPHGLQMVHQHLRNRLGWRVLHLLCCGMVDRPIVGCSGLRYLGRGIGHAGKNGLTLIGRRLGLQCWIHQIYNPGCVLSGRGCAHRRIDRSNWDNPICPRRCQVCAGGAQTG